MCLMFSSGSPQFHGHLTTQHHFINLYNCIIDTLPHVLVTFTTSFNVIINTCVLTLNDMWQRCTLGTSMVTCSESDDPLKKWMSWDLCILQVVGSYTMQAFFLLLSPRST